MGNSDRPQGFAFLNILKRQMEDTLAPDAQLAPRTVVTHSDHRGSYEVPPVRLSAAQLILEATYLRSTMEAIIEAYEHKPSAADGTCFCAACVGRRAIEFLDEQRNGHTAG